MDVFTSKITEILDRMAPIKKFQIKTKYVAWLGISTKDRMKTRDLAQQTASASGLPEDWAKYKIVRNEVTSMLRKDKAEWQQKKLDSCEESSDTGKLWKNVLGWLNWSSTSSPTKLMNQGNLATSPLKIAEIQNKYYIDKVHTIRGTIRIL